MSNALRRTVFQRSFLNLLPAVAVLLITACGDDVTQPSDPDPEPDPFQVASVEFTAESLLLLEVGEDEAMEARVNGMALTELPDEAPTPSWSSSAPEVAEVSAQGLVTAMGEGSATIQLELDDHQATREVEVAPEGTTVGPDGGLLTFADGAVELEVSEGAVSSRVRIRVEPLEGTPEELGLAEGVPGSGFRVEAPGRAQGDTVRGTITITVTNTPPGVFSPMLRVHRRSLDQADEWHLLPGDGGVSTATGDSVRVTSSPFEIDTEMKVAGIRPSPSDQVTLGARHACSLSQDDTLYCWGDNREGQVSQDPEGTGGVPLPGPEGLRPRLLASGSASSCAVDRDDDLWCWGRIAQAFGGGGGKVNVNEWGSRAPIQSLAVGQDHACALDGEGQVWCWGNNERGQLGTGDGGSGSDEPIPVKQGDRNFIQVSAGPEITMALDSEGMVYAWGAVFQDPDSDGDTVLDLYEPTQILQEVTQGHPFIQLSTGADVACGVDDEGQIWCWGDNSWGQRGTGQVGSDGGLRPVALSTDAVGDPRVEVVNDPPSAQHVCARDEGGTLWCWGSNERGQLGSTSSQHCRADGVVRSCSPTPEPVSGLPPVESFAVGAQSSCAVASDSGRLYCWGSNEHGELGVGEISEGASQPTEAATGRPER
jgi:alpha-tubulin suppressor-like RCC1 family protein